IFRSGWKSNALWPMSVGNRRSHSGKDTGALPESTSSCRQGKHCVSGSRIAHETSDIRLQVPLLVQGIGQPPPAVPSLLCPPPGYPSLHPQLLAAWARLLQAERDQSGRVPVALGLEGSAVPPLPVPDERGQAETSVSLLLTESLLEDSFLLRARQQPGQLRRR